MREWGWGGGGGMRDRQTDRQAGRDRQRGEPCKRKSLHCFNAVRVANSTEQKQASRFGVLLESGRPGFD